MSRTRLISGAVVAGTVLLGGGVLYVWAWPRVPHEIAVAVIAEEDPPAGLCPEGYTCAKYRDMQGGCLYVPCCPQGQPYCGQDTKSHIAFPRYTAPESRGDCVKFDGAETAYCQVTDCGGTDYCPSEDCVAQGTGEPLKKPYPVLNGVCGGQVE